VSAGTNKRGGKKKGSKGKSNEEMLRFYHLGDDSAKPATASRSTSKPKGRQADQMAPEGAQGDAPHEAPIAHVGAARAKRVKGHKRQAPSVPAAVQPTGEHKVFDGDAANVEESHEGTARRTGAEPQGTAAPSDEEASSSEDEAGADARGGKGDGWPAHPGQDAADDAEGEARRRYLAMRCAHATAWPCLPRAPAFVAEYAQPLTTLGI
jgi:hypothetical protein